MIRHLRDRVAIIDVRSGEVRAFLPFAARPIIEAVEADERRWNAEHECWIVPLSAVGQLVRDLTGADYEVDVWTGNVLHTYYPDKSAYGRAA